MTRWLPRLLLLLAWLPSLGCQKLIDLGPEAKRQDSGTQDGLSACGFGEASTSQACVDCLESRCCDENRACSQDSVCAEQKVALTECIYDVDCIQSVIADAGANSKVVAFSSCATSCTLSCFPTGECLKLALCCQNLNSLVRSGCAETVESADEQRCGEARTTFNCPP